MLKERTWLTIIASLFVLAIFVSLWQVGSKNSPESISAMKALSAVQSYKKQGIGILRISGPITFKQDSPMSSGSGVQSLLKQLQEFEKDTLVKGLIIQINSPGGTVGASQELYQAISRLKENRQIPVIASIGDIGTSGAYYAALAADTIFANPGTMVGSIGVIMGNINIATLAKNYGFDFNVYKSGEHKDILSPWRQPTAAEDTLLSTVIKDVHNQFVKVVKKERSLKGADISKLTDGRFFSGTQALKVGLIDHVGSFSDALTYISKKAKLSDPPTLISKEKTQFSDYLRQLSNPFSAISHALSSFSQFPTGLSY